jgi:hypothetical protein
VTAGRGRTLCPSVTAAALVRVALQFGAMDTAGVGDRRSRVIWTSVWYVAYRQDCRHA